LVAKHRSSVSPSSTIARGFNEGLARPNVFEIDLDAIAQNTRRVRAAVGNDVRIYVAVKGNGYGYGLSEISTTVLQHGADALAMADVRGAVQLRERGIGAPILLYAGAMTTPETVAAVADNELSATVLDLQSAQAFSKYSKKPVGVFVKVNVGLERLGVPAAQAPQFVADIVRLPNLRLEGVYTHLHVVAGPEVGRYATWQFDLFANALEELRKAGIVPRITLASSSNVLALTSSMVLNAVDPGRLIYGLPTLHEPRDMKLTPAFGSLRTRLIQVKSWKREGWSSLAPFDPAGVDRVGVLPIGRSDGLGALHAGEVLVDGERARILGPISLEHTRVDLTKVPNAAVGDEVVIIGTQGTSRISVDEVVEHQRSSSLNLALEVRESVLRRYKPVR
jgi:alanine racemase